MTQKKQDLQGLRVLFLIFNCQTPVYDIEPNDYIEKDLAKRTRYYNSMIDVKLLKTQEDFGELPELFSIWILPHDPFNDNRMVYTVKNTVEENPQIVYNDGVTNLFLYIGGTVGGTEELHNLLAYMGNTSADKAVDSDLAKIQSIVNTVKDDKKVGERYMSMEKIIESAKQKSYNEGRYSGFAEGHDSGFAIGFTEGRNKTIHSFIESYIEDGFSSELIKKKLTTKFNLSESDADLYLSEYFK